MRRRMKVLCFLVACHMTAMEAQQSVRVALVQSHLAWGDVDANLKAFGKRTAECEECDLIILPELFASGCEMKQETDTKQATAARFGEIETTLRKWATQKRAVVIGSAVYANEGKYYNRLIAAFPNGNVRYYDKRNCFKKGSFTPGKEALVFEHKGIRFATFICYDLRFPEWCRNNGHYDAALYIANWPASRRDDWNRLLKERAVENRVYVAAVNCAGYDPNRLYYAGDSQLLSPEGEILSRCGEGTDEICYGTILLPDTQTTKEGIQTPHP